MNFSARLVIVTKLLSPTANRGTRIKASTSGFGNQDRSVTIAWDHALDAKENHHAACMALMDQFNWKWEAMGAWMDERSAVWMEKI